MTIPDGLYDTTSYTAIAGLFLRLLGAIYFAVFSAFLFQAKGLFGKNGILPIEDFLSEAKNWFGRKRFYRVPTVFWWKSSDKAIMSVMAAGTLLSLLLIFNVYPPLILSLLFILHLSVVSSGQDFLSFGWESFLLEITFNAILLSLTALPNPFIWMSLNLLLFRFHFQAGASKILSGDENWRNLTALKYHYQSQPLPNTQAWYIYKFPMWFHKLSVLMMFFIELVVPFGIFGSEAVRLWVFIFFFGLQFMIWATGNFSYLNHMTVVLSTLLISNNYLVFFETSQAPPLPANFLLNNLIGVVGFILIILQLISLWNYFLPNRKLMSLLAWIQPFHIINRYGIFAVMTTKRYEVVIEGSMDGVFWKEYAFYYKPSEPDRRPRRISPFQPRIDWQAWFLPFTNFESEWWFQSLLVCILKGAPDVLKLLRHNPFPEKPPVYIRAVLYDYEFSSIELKKKFGLWWNRRLIGFYSPIKELDMHEAGS